ncbi:MAG TPA: HWE histidine kinase domain-containing protein [Brevundimonas sp.]|uniref:sensor histidine kinase n=1 Tax=Brevundimonas sp. TaxID=1871086 RepID=UPI00260EA1B7|nr:HWE histidine kinase domain-containing protein [Brevundimonas sp.]HRO32901.1 HWE histidine kinase domain-containing protein [Brevundimonas sp.]
MDDLVKADDRAVDLATAFDASPNPYMLLTPELRYAGMNQAYLDVTRRRREDLMGRHVMEAFDANGDTTNADLLRHSFEKVLATGETDRIAILHYAIPLPDDAGALRYVDKYWSCTHTPVRDDGGRLRFILQHTTDITELHALRSQAGRGRADEGQAVDALLGGRVMRQAEDIQEKNRQLETERTRLFELFLQAPGFIAVLSGPDHVFELTNAAYATVIGRTGVEGRTLRDALPDLAGQGFYELLDNVYQTGEPYEGKNQKIRLQRTPDGPLEDLFLNFIYQPIRDGAGKIAGIFVQGHDVTETVLAAERQKLMIDELNHRVKNTLATVQSIAMQTARHHPDPKGFAEAFQSRLMSLSHTHDLLTRSHWEGADLRAVLQHETDARGGPTRIVPNGPPVALDPAQVLSLGMVFHELATNAGKYGALSTPDGRVFVDWSVADQRAPRLHLTWRESGGPPAQPPQKHGFGSRLIERNVRHDLAGEIELHYGPEGFRADISMPLRRGE